MKKRLGLIFLFAGSYLTLIGGLVWVMHFSGSADTSSLCRPYDWVWGVITAVILIIGTVMSIKGYIFGLIGLAIVLIGIAGNIWLLFFGLLEQEFLSPLVLFGTNFVLFGFIWTLIAHIKKMIKIAKHGHSLLD